MRRTIFGFFLLCLWVALLIMAGCATDSKVARVPDPPPVPAAPPARERPPELPADLPSVQALPKPGEIGGEVFNETAIFPVLSRGRYPGCADGLLPGKQL